MVSPLHRFKIDENVKIINNPILLDKGSIDKVLTKRDISCEYELMKLITDEPIYKQNMVAIPKIIKNENRYLSILPCLSLIKLHIIVA